MRKRQAPQRQAPRLRARAAEPGGYWTGAHTTHRLRYHLVWVPKYRCGVLEGPVVARLTALLRQACEVNRWGLHELSVQPDHVHLLVRVPPIDCISGVLGSLKGGTSRVLRSEFPDLEEYLWGENFWADGYFAESVGQTEEAVVWTYIKNHGLPRRPPRPRRTRP